MSSKKLLAASAAGNIIPAKKVESSDVLSSDCSSDEDDVGLLLSFCLNVILLIYLL